MSQSSQGFIQGSISGILGLGFPRLMATPNSVPWWIRLVQDGQLRQNETLFAFWLSRFVVDIVSWSKLTAASVATCGSLFGFSNWSWDPLSIDLLGTGVHPNNSPAKSCRAASSLLAVSTQLSSLGKSIISVYPRSAGGQYRWILSL